MINTSRALMPFHGDAPACPGHPEYSTVTSMAARGALQPLCHLAGETIIAASRSLNIPFFCKDDLAAALLFSRRPDDRYSSFYVSLRQGTCAAPIDARPIRWWPQPLILLQAGHRILQGSLCQALLSPF